MTDPVQVIDPIIIEQAADGSGGDTFLSGGPIFPMPKRRWQPNPSVLPGVALTDSDTTNYWLVVSPRWRCSPVTWPSGYLCPSEGLCAIHGPRCDGRNNSGWIYGMTGRVNSLPIQTTQGGTGIYIPTIGDYPITYRTQYPYVAGTLSVTFQGLALIKGTDYIEVDPALGTFQMISAPATDNSSELMVTYQRLSLTATTGPEPGTYPPEAGYDPPAPVPGSGNIYRPANQRQFGWGTVYDAWNCNMACSAMLLDRHTMGRNTRYVGVPASTPPAHRSYSGVTAVAGTGHDDAKRAWTNGWGQSYTYPGTVPWSYFVNQIQSGRGATVFGRYAYMDSNYKKSQTFDGPHAIYINEELSDGSFWGYDPIVGYPIVYPYNVLRTYADSYNGFRDRIQAGYSRVTPNI